MLLKNLHTRYAQALYDLARKKNFIPTILKDVQDLQKIHQSVPAFGDFFRSPLQKPKQKIKIITEIFAKYFHPTTLTFLSFLITKQRGFLLEGILHHFETLYKESQHIHTAYLTTVRALSPALRERIVRHAQKLMSKDEKVDLIEKIDSSLIGGYILKIHNQQLDMSVRTHLIRLKKHWEQTPLPQSNHVTS